MRYVQDYSEGGESPRMGGTMTADSDAFYFRVTVEGHDGPIEDGSGGEGEPHKFAIAIVTLRVRPVRNAPLRMFGVREAAITDSHLLYQTQPEPVPDADLVYSLESAPRRGALLLAGADYSLQGTHSIGFTRNGLSFITNHYY